MQDDGIVVGTSTTGAGTPISVPGFQIDFLELFSSFSNSVGSSGPGFSWYGILDFFSSVWSVYAVLAYIATAFLIFGYVYASIRTSEIDEVVSANLKAQEDLMKKTQGVDVKNTQWEDTLEHIESDNPNDWKLAIIEADVMLEDLTKERGYAGNTLGERLKSISPSHLQSIDDAWDAHKVRNQIAHGGADFVLTHKLARQTIMQYQRVFTELGML